MFFARNSTSWRPDSFARSVPRTATLPWVGLRSPAIMEIRVVLPQPDGPTRSVSCPSYTSRSTPRRASVLVPLAPNSFVTPLQDTAACNGPFAAGGGLIRAAVAIICVSLSLESSPEDDGGFERQHPPRADDARGDHDHEHRRPRPEQGHPGHVQAGQVRDVPRGDEEQGGQPHAQTEADAAHE